MKPGYKNLVFFKISYTYRKTICIEMKPGYKNWFFLKISYTYRKSICIEMKTQNRYRMFTISKQKTAISRFFYLKALNI